MPIIYDTSELLLLHDLINRLFLIDSIAAKIPSIHFSAAVKKEVYPYTRTFRGHQKVIYELVLSNHGNSYNPNTGHFVCPVDGSYGFFLHVRKHGQNEWCALRLIKNGTEQARLSADVGIYETDSNFVIIPCKKNEAVWVVTMRDCILLGSGSGNHNTFSGFRIA